MISVVVDEAIKTAKSKVKQYKVENWMVKDVKRSEKNMCKWHSNDS